MMVVRTFTIRQTSRAQSARSSRLGSVLTRMSFSSGTPRMANLVLFEERGDLSASLRERQGACAWASPPS